MNNSLLSIIIVNWNTRELTSNCLNSIYGNQPQKQFNVEIIVVDNASEDDSVQHIRENFPEVKLIANTTNLGYARANNQGLSEAKGEIIILMNSDTLLKTPNCFQSVLATFNSKPEAGIIGAKLLFPNGNLQAAGRAFISVWGLFKSQILFSTSPLFLKLRNKHLNQARNRYLTCDYVDGAFLAVRWAVVDEIGLLNEEFFMYGEDMEWCARARKSGWEVIVDLELEVIHFHAQSSKKNYKRILVENTMNNCKLLMQNYGRNQARLGFYIYLAGMWLRMVLSLFRDRRQVKEYWYGLSTCWQKKELILGQ